MSDENDAYRFPRVRFNPEVNLGHIISILVMAGSVIAGYVNIQKDLATQRSEYMIAIAGFETRLSVAEHSIIERRNEDREFATEMRAAVVEIQKSLTNLQLQLVERAKAR